MSNDHVASTKPSVLFVCVHNAGRSQMAAGYLEHLAGGRIDVLTDRYAVEVEFPHKWHEGLGQALHYSNATGKQGMLAVIAYAQGEANLHGKSRETLEMIEKICLTNDIKMVVLFPNRPEEFNHQPVPANN